MRFSRVLLVVPEQFKGVREHHTRPPVGIGYVAEALYQSGIEYTIVDIGLGYTFEDLKKRILEFKPDMIGITAMTYGYKNVYDMINTINAITDVPIIVGGPHAFALREKLFKECPAVDFSVPAEGEDIIVELCSGKDPSEINGMYYRDGDDVKFTGIRELIQDYDKRPFPKYRNFELEKYARFSKEITVQSSRGCPFNCIFCSSSQTFGKKFRAKMPEVFVDEIEYWYKRDYKKIHICDDNFTLVNDRVFEICDEIEKRGIKVKFFVGGGVRADRLTREMLFRMKDVGFDTISIPFEAGNDKILANLNKGEKIEDIKKAVKNACDAGINVVLFFLVGSPGETWEDFMDSVKLAQEFPVIDAKFYSIIPLPKTELYNWIEKNNYFVREPRDFLNDMLSFDDNPAFETPEMSKADRIKALNYANKVRQKILKKHRKLIPYLYSRIKGKVIK